MCERVLGPGVARAGERQPVRRDVDADHVAALAEQVAAALGLAFTHRHDDVVHVRVEPLALSQQMLVAPGHERDHRGVHARSRSSAARAFGARARPPARPAVAAAGQRLAEDGVPLLRLGPARADDGQPRLRERAGGGVLLVVRARLRQHDGRTPRGGDVGDRVLPRMGDDHVGGAEQRPGVVDPAVRRRAEHGPGPAGGSRAGRRRAWRA